MNNFTVQSLTALLAGDDRIELDEACLDLASIEAPHLNRSACLAQLDDWAAIIQSRLRPGDGGAQYLAAANRFLFQEMGLAGESDDYFHPRNSCLSHALQARRGLPIVLSVLYIEIARRCLRPVYGIALPAHFIALYDDGLISTYVDPYHQGRLLTRQQCVEMVMRLTGQDISDRDNLFAPATKRDILSRMLLNLKGSYTRQDERAKVMKVIPLLLQGTHDPEAKSRLAAELHSIQSRTADRN